MTLSELRGAKPAPAPEAGEESRHPGPALYVKIGIIIAITEAAEIGSYYLGLGSWPRTALLIPLMVINFALIVLWFMHLRFDAPLFVWTFAGGLVLASALFVIVLATLGGGLF